MNARCAADYAAELEAGRDVVIGVLETHGRAGTAAGLEVLPRRRVAYRGTAIDEMDLPGILARAPELCLIDELAHSNAPGSEHVKRFEDIEDVLAAGIDLLSTVNVQHLESLNDRVAELSGVRVRETVPDDVLGRADEIVLIDLSPRRASRGDWRRGSSGCVSRRGPSRGRGRARATRWRPTRRAPSASGCSRSSSRCPARSGSCGARPPRGPARLRTPLPQRLMNALPGVDVRIVADRSRRPEDPT